MLPLRVLAGEKIWLNGILDLAGAAMNEYGRAAENGVRFDEVDVGVDGAAEGDQFGSVLMTSLIVNFFRLTQSTKTK